MEFRLLGPRRGTKKEGDSARRREQRALLRLLLLDRGRAVSTDRLVDEIWAGAPPQTAAKSIQVYVSGLRKLLGEGRIVTRERGYELRVESGETDVDRFDELVRTRVRGATCRSRRAAPGRTRSRPGKTARRRLARAVGGGGSYEARGADSRGDGSAYRRRPRARGHRELIPDSSGSSASIASGRASSSSSCSRSTAAGVRRTRSRRTGAARLAFATSSVSSRVASYAISRLPSCDTIPTSSSRSSRPSAARRCASRRRRAWMLVVAGAIAAVLAATAATAVAVTHGDASLESLPPGIALLDAETGHLRAHISEKEIAQPVEVVAGAGNLWVWNLQPHSLVRIDPANGEITASVGSPFGGDAGWYLPDGDDVWFAGLHDLARVNVEQGQEVDRFHLTDAEGRFGLTSVARCAGSLWIANNDEGVVLRVDPETGAVQARVPTIFPWPVACGDGGIWVGSNPAGLRRIDPRTNTIVATAHTQDQYVPSPLAAAMRGRRTRRRDGLQGRPERSDRRDLRDRRRPTKRVLREWSALGLEHGRGDGHGHRRDEWRHADVPVRAPAPERRCARGRAARRARRRPDVGGPIDSLQGDVAKVIVPIYSFDPPDPALGVDWPMFMVERATCSMLLGRPSGSGGSLEPDLASAPSLISADGRTYTFDVRSGVRFAPPSNATVTAEAVRRSVERALSSELGDHSPGIGVLGDLEGAVAFNEGRARHVSGIHVRGSTISFRLTRPAPDFVERISLPYFCTVPTDTPIVHGGVQPIAPPSAGPFYMAEHENGEYMILKRNPNYDGPEPSLDAIGFREGIAPEQAVARVDSGLADAVLASSEPLLVPDGPVAERPQASATSRYEALPQLAGALIALNAGRQLFSDVKVRRAVDRAIDRAALASIWSETPSASLLRPGIPGYRPVPGLSLAGGDLTRLRPTQAGADGGSGRTAIRVNGRSRQSALRSPRSGSTSLPPRSTRRSPPTSARPISTSSMAGSKSSIRTVPAC